MVRPSFVLGGRGMKVIYDEAELIKHAEEAIQVSPEYPMLIDRFLEQAIETEVDALCVMSRHKRVMVKVGAFYALGKKQPPYDDLIPLIRRVVQAFGPKRCMWETDCPFQVANHKYEDSLALIRDHADFLSADDKVAILRTTAETLLFNR